MDIESIDDNDSIVKAEWRGETLLVRGYASKNYGKVNYRVLGFMRGKETINGDGVRYGFEPIAKRKQKNCRAFMRGSPDFNGRSTHPDRISFAPGYDVVAVEHHDPSRVRVN